MKRQFQKALSIVVASSLALSMPVTTMADEAVSRTTVGGAERSVENQTEKTESGGISVSNGETVTKHGDVAANNTHGVAASGNSKVTVDGNVTTSGDQERIAGIYNAGSDVKVTGNVTSDAYGVVAEENASTTVNGSVTAKSTGVNISTGYNDKTTQDSVLRVDKGITVTGGRQSTYGKDDSRTRLNADGVDITKATKGEGNVDLQVNGDILTTTKNERDDKNFDSASSTGLGIRNLSGEVSAKIDGNIKADSFAGNSNYATGVIIIGGDEKTPADKTQKTDVSVKGDISAKSDHTATGINFDSLHGTTNVTVDGNIDADAKDGKAYGILLSTEDRDSTTTIIVNGDVKGSSYGTNFDGFDGTANVVINGTLSGGKSAVIINKITETDLDENDEDKVVTKKYGYNGNSNITVWKMTSEQKDLVRVEEQITDYTQDKDECNVDAEATNNVLKNINYIIRTDKVSNGTIHLSNTRLISGFDTARETEDITIKVEASDGYKVDSVKNGDAVLKKNSDGTYTLTVPRGGGVQLSAVLSAIQKSHSSSSGSSSSSHSSASSVNVQTTSSASGATVATTVADSNGTRNTNAVVKIANKQATVNTSEQTGNGNSIIIRNVSGDVAGATFTGAGTVSSDGKSIATTDGQVHAVTQAPMLVIKTGDQSVGCFVDLTTGAPLATGKTEVYYQLAADGQMYAHWVNPMGFFYTGTVVMNGHTITFNEQGVMIDVR